MVKWTRFCLVVDFDILDYQDYFLYVLKSFSRLILSTMIRSYH